MSERISDFAFSLYRILHIFLYNILPGFPIQHSLDLENAWAVRIFDCLLYKVPHSFAFLPMDSLFDVLYLLVLLLGLSIDQTVTEVHLP